MSIIHASRLKSLLTAGLAIVVVGVAAGCESTDAASNQSAPAPAAATATSAKTQPSDYSYLLLQAKDVSIPPDSFTVRSTKTDPEGQTGMSALFVNADDTRAIVDTILIYPDAATASATLRQGAAAVSAIVVGGTPQPTPVGSDGTVLSGTAPDGSKAVTLLMFTQGRAVVQLQFDSNVDDPPTPQMVTSVGRMQEIALRIGLPERE